MRDKVATARWRLCFAGICALLLCFSAMGREYTVVHLKESPELDGDVAPDAAWTGVAPAQGFREYRSEEAATHATEFRLGYTVDGIYVAAVCAEPNPDNLHADLGDGEALWDEDSVELFFSPDAEKELQFAVNPMGSRASNHTLRKWAAVGFINEGSWTVEVFIPWEVLGACPEESESWRFNVCRNIFSLDPIEQTTWAEVEGTFHDLANFATLNFETIPHALRDAIQERILEEPIQDVLFLFSRFRAGLLRMKNADEDRILYKQGAHLAPRIAPDSKDFLFNSNVGAAPDLWLANMNGEIIKRICEGDQVCWSNDGARILFVRKGNIIEKDLESGEENLFNDRSGLRLAFPSYLNEEKLLCIDATRDRLIMLSRDGAASTLAEGEIGIAPAAAPDEKHVAFQEGAHLYLLDLESRKKTLITTMAGIQSCPVWSKDSRALCFLSAAHAKSSEQDLYYVELERPETVYRIRRRVLPGYHWNGVKPECSNPQSLTAPRAKVRRKDGIENAWLSLTTLDGEKLKLISRQGGPKVTLRVSDKNRSEALQIASVQASQDALLLVDFIRKNGATARGRFRLLIEAPLLECSFDAPGISVDFQATIEHIVVPDRLADDLVLSTSAMPDNPLTLPPSPITLGLMKEKGAMLVLLRTEEEQRLQAAKADQKDHASLAIRPAAKPCYLGVLSGEQYWQTPELSQEENGRWRAKWSKPFSANWRIAVRGQQTDQGAAESYARMWSHEYLRDLGREPLLLGERFQSQPEAAAVYLWSRGENTPINAFTPTNLGWAAMGITGWRKHVDELGLCGYRTGDVEVPFRTLASRPATWSPWMAHHELEEFGVLDVLRGVFLAGTPGVRTYVQHMTSDAIHILKGLDARAAEYAQFLDKFPVFLEARQDKIPVPLLESLGQECRELRGEMSLSSELTEVACVAQESLMEVVASRNDAKCILEVKEFQDFFAACKSAAEGRTKQLQQIRARIGGWRNAIAKAVLLHPQFAGAAAELLEHTQEILRNRFYLEADWRGETPRQKESATCNTLCTL